MTPQSCTRIVAIALTAFAAGMCMAQATPSTTPDGVRAQIRELGYLPFILRHFDGPVWAESIIPGIERAEPAWLEIAAILKPHADGAASQELGLALYVALAVEPLVVLPVLQRVYGHTPKQLCTQTFEAELPRQGVATYLQSIEQGLRKGTTNAQRALAKSCLKGIVATRTFARKHGLK